MRETETVRAEQVVMGDIVQSPIDPDIWVHITEISFMPHDDAVGVVYRFAGHPHGYNGAYVEHGTVVTFGASELVTRYH